jgi:hypothetical protein
MRLIQLRYDAYLQVSEETVPAQIQAAVSLLTGAPYVMIGIAIVAALNNRGAFWWWAAATSVGIELFFGIGSGSKGAALMPLILIGLSWNYARPHFSRKQGIVIFLLTALVFAILFPLNSIYRESLIAAGRNEQSAIQSYVVLSDAAAELAATDPKATVALAAQYLASRLSNLQAVANILRHQELGGERHWGASYALFLPSFIPRFLWADKPNVTISQSFGVELGYGEAQFYRKGNLGAQTSVAVTRVGELVYNFPPVLAPFGMILFGMLFRWLYEVMLIGRQVSPELAVGAYAFWWYALLAAGEEGNLASVFSGMIKGTLVMLILFWLLGFAKLGATKNPAG